MKRETRSEHNPVEASSEEAATIAHRLAPLEEQESADVLATGHGRKGGAILLNTAELKLPKDFTEEDKKGRFLGLEPIVIFIVLLLLGFIAFIAYLISIEPS